MSEKPLIAASIVCLVFCLCLIARISSLGRENAWLKERREEAIEQIQDLAAEVNGLELERDSLTAQLARQKEYVLILETGVDLNREELKEELAESRDDRERVDREFANALEDKHALQIVNEALRYEVQKCRGELACRPVCTCPGCKCRATKTAQ